MIARRTLAWLACAAAVALAMGRSLGNGFVYDDVVAIVRNARVTDPAQWHTIPTSPYWIGTLWRPFTTAAFAMEWRIGHGHAWVFHLTSVLAYTVLAWMLLGLLRRTGVSDRVALGVTLLFVVHPVHVEVVANSVGQSELWCALALVGATRLYLDARRRGATLGATTLVIAMVIVGIASKEVGYAAPLLLIGAEWLLLRDDPATFGTRLRWLVPIGAIAVALFVFRAGVLTSFVGELPTMALNGVTLPGRGLVFLAVTAQNARLLFWPWHLQAEYGPPGIPVDGSWTTGYLFGALVLIAAAAIFVRARRRQPVIAFGVWWMAMTLLPIANLITPTGMVMSERALFLPTIGLSLVIGGAVDALRQTRWRRAEAARTTAVLLGGVAVAWGIAAVARSATRVTTWRTQDAFFSHLTLDAPVAYRAWAAAGEYRDEIGDTPAAVASLQHAIALWPHDYQVYERLGQVLRHHSQCDRAVPVFEAGLRIQPDALTLRASLIECLIAVHDWDDADRTAAAGLALGEPEFQMEQRRIDRSRAAVDSGEAQP